MTETKVTAGETPIDYEAISAEFEQALSEKLRQHGMNEPFLEFWVPEADPVKGIVGMVDSARIAGYDKIAIRFTTASVPSDRVEELRQRLANIAEIVLVPQDNGTILRASGFRAESDQDQEARTVRRRERAYWQPTNDQVTSAQREAHLVAPAARGATTAAFADVPLNFRAGMARTLASVSHEGGLAAEAGLQLLQASTAKVTLAALIDPADHVVRRLRHQGAESPSLRAALETFCRLGEGVPIQEAADHIGLRAIEAMMEQIDGGAVPGVVLPANQPSIFGTPIALIREIRDAYCAETGATKTTNFYHAAPGPRWLAMSQAERMAEVTRALEGFLATEHRAPADVVVHQLGKNRYGHPIRVIVDFADHVAIDDRPGLMRRFERHIRAGIEPELELLAERVKDKSVLRRLS